MNTQTATDPLTEDERIVYDADEYLGSIMMDGHGLTLANKGLQRIREMERALERLRANGERALLGEALLLWEQRGCTDFDEPDDDMRSAMEALDEQFFEAASAEDSLEIRTKHYVRDHLDTFVVLE